MVVAVSFQWYLRQEFNSLQKNWTLFCPESNIFSGGCPWVSIMYLSWEDSRIFNQTGSQTQTFKWHTIVVNHFNKAWNQVLQKKYKAAFSHIVLLIHCIQGTARNQCHSAQRPYVYGFCKRKPWNNLRRPGGWQREMIVTFFVIIDHLDKYDLYYSWQTHNRKHKHWILCHSARKRLNLIPATCRYGWVWM